MLDFPCIFFQFAIETSLAFWGSYLKTTQESVRIIDTTVQCTMQAVHGLLRTGSYAEHVSGNLYRIERGVELPYLRVKRKKFATVLHMPGRAVA